MNKSWILYGPQGCRKTLHAPTIADMLGLNHINDEWDMNPETTALTDTLHITNELPDWVGDSESLQAISHDDAWAKLKERWASAVVNAKKVLKPGDRIRVTKCPGTKRTITFASWDGNWIVSKSGIDDYAASNIDMLNGEPVDFCSQ